MTTRELLQLRLQNLCITPQPGHTIAGVVSALGAMQAQDYLGALWAIGLRVPGSTEADVEQAIADRIIVRTWPMRGTLHFVAAEDARWMTELMAPRVIARAAGRHRQLELNAATFTRARKVLQRALQGGKILSRPAAFNLLEKSRISPKGQRGIHILQQLTHEGLLCFGPREGKQFTFTLFDEWLPDAKSRDHDASLAEIALRYFTSHGPATFNDFVGWTGLKITEARQGLEAVASNLVKETLRGIDYWLPNGKPPPSKTTTCLHLLPGFDEYLLGYKDRSAALHADHSQKIIPGGNGMFFPTMVRDGRIVGTWKRDWGNQSVNVSLHPFERLDAKTGKSMAKQAAAYAAFVQRPLQLIS